MFEHIYVKKKQCFLSLISEILKLFFRLSFAKLQQIYDQIAQNVIITQHTQQQRLKIFNTG